MMARYARRLLLHTAFAVHLVLFSMVASAQQVQFTVQGDGGERLLTLNTVTAEGVEYVSLQSLVQDAGGSFNALPARLRVDLGGSTAWLRVGEARVNALSIFSLGHPVREENGVPLLAASDVPDFFLKSFRVTARPAVAEAPAPMATAPGAPAPSGAAPLARPLEPLDEPEALEQLGELQAAPTAISRVVIDPGHGGYDPGVQSGEALSEEAITLAVAEQLKGLIESDGRFAAVLTRTEDTDMSFAQRTAIAGAGPGTLLISLHVGSSPSPGAEGIAVFYATPAAIGQGSGSASTTSVLLGVDHRMLVEGRKLAGALGAALVASAGAPVRGILEAPLRMQSDLSIASAQIELGCLSNPTDAQRLASEGYLARLATGIFNGITAYIDGELVDPTTPPDAPVVSVEN